MSEVRRGREPRDVTIVGGGPAGLYLAILLKKRSPEGRVVVQERNRAGETFGFGVVFSDATLAQLRDVDAESAVAIDHALHHWDDIDVHYRGETITSTGHGFSGLSRRVLLDVLTARATALGAEIVDETEVDPEALVGRRDRSALIVAADGVNSRIRERMSESFGPTIDLRPNRFVWLGTSRPFPAFTFHFKESEHGLFRVHAYQYAALPVEAGRPISTFIVECTAETWARAGLDRATEADTIAYCERLFADELDGHRLVGNRSIWRNFPTIRCARWHDDGVVLLGDAAHTAHFSIGSGTKLAMEDSIALAEVLLGTASHADVDAALAAYEAARRPAVEAIQRAADVSLRWFEETERYFGRLSPLAFSFSMLTRSLRITHEGLKARDPLLVAQVDAEVASIAQSQARVAVAPKTPPMFTPFRLRELVLPNRVVVSPMCQYSAEDGAPNDWHLVHYGSRAVGGAGLVMTEMTDVSADARITPGCSGLYTDEHTTAWRRIVDFVHESGPSKIGVQLAHAGRKGSTRLMWEGIDRPLRTGNWPLIAPSALPYAPENQTPRAMDRADMDRVRDDFVAATKRAIDAGFDLVELHFAHGYLLGSFLSPLTNRRDDRYGGSLDNRMRFPLEVFEAARAVWPGDRPLNVRLSATDWVDGGFSDADALGLARALKERGCDAIDVSTGQTVPEGKPIYGRLFQTPFSDRIRNESSIATITVGNVSSWADVNAIIAAGRADLVALARGHLYDPYWTRHAAAEQGFAMPWPPQYLAATSFTPR